MARGVASLVIRQCNFKRWQSHLVLLVMFGLTGKIGIAKPVAPTRRPCPSSRASRTVFPIISRVRSLLHPSRRTRSSRRRRSRHDKKNLRLLRCPVQSRSRHRQLARKIPKQCAANRLCLCRIQRCVGRARRRPGFPRRQSGRFRFSPL